MKYPNRLFGRTPVIPFISLAIPIHAETLVEHRFGGSAEAPLNELHADTNRIRPVPWNAGPILAANGQVNDGTNTDQGLVLDLGLSWKFRPQSTYTITLGFSNLDNAVLFAGFRDANPSGNAQVQTQGNVFALRVREIAGSDNVGIFQWPGGIFTDSGLSYETNASATFTLTLETNDLTNAVVSIGDARVTLDLTAHSWRYFFAGYEDPTAASPPSDAKLDFLELAGPLPPPLPLPRLVSYDAEEGEATIAWLSVEDESYTLQGSSDLADWQPLDGSDWNPFAGDGSEIEFTDLAEGPRKFYRLIRP